MLNLLLHFSKRLTIWQYMSHWCKLALLDVIIMLSFVVVIVIESDGV